MTKLDFIKYVNNLSDSNRSLKRALAIEQSHKLNAQVCTALLLIFLIATNSGWLFAFLWFGGNHG